MALSQQILDLTLRYQVRMSTSRVVSVPRPTLKLSSIQSAVEQLYDIFSDDRQELPAVERSSSCNIQISAMWMSRDDEVLIGGNAIPVTPMILEGSIAHRAFTYQHIRKDSKLTFSSSLPNIPRAAIRTSFCSSFDTTCWA